VQAVQAWISLEHWQPSWGVESAFLSIETTGVHDSSLNSSHPFYNPLPSYWQLSRSGSGPGREIPYSSSSTISTVHCLSAKRAIADHPPAVYSLIHITRVFVATGTSQTEDPAALILGQLVFSFFQSMVYLTDNPSQTKPHQRLLLVSIPSFWRLSRLSLSSVMTSPTSNYKTLSTSSNKDGLLNRATDMIWQVYKESEGRGEFRRMIDLESQAKLRLNPS